MVRSWRMLGGMAMLAVAALAPVGAMAETLKVMTFNVRYASDEGAERWAARRPVMVELIRRAVPDVIGTQELLQRQGDDIVRALPGYRWFGRDRMGGHDDEHMGIFYRPDRLTLVDQGDFWLSDTPEVVGSQSWGTDLPRMASWAVFETKDAKPRRFLFVDTHLAHRDEDAEARDKAAALILARLPTLAKGLPVILAGDISPVRGRADRLLARRQAARGAGDDLSRLHRHARPPDRLSVPARVPGGRDRDRHLASRQNLSFRSFPGPGHPILCGRDPPITSLR